MQKLKPDQGSREEEGVPLPMGGGFGCMADEYLAGALSLRELAGGLQPFYEL